VILSSWSAVRFANQKPDFLALTELHRALELCLRRQGAPPVQVDAEKENAHKYLVLFKYLQALGFAARPCLQARRGLAWRL